MTTLEEETNMELNKMYEELGISEKVLKFGTEIEESLKERFEAIDENAEYNQMKVLKAMQEARVSDIHFAATTGYGYNDLGRDTLEEVYAKAFHGEDALVRPPWKYTAYGGLIGPSALSSMEEPCTKAPAAMMTGAS